MTSSIWHTKRPAGTGWYIASTERLGTHVRYHGPEGWSVPVHVSAFDKSHPVPSELDPDQSKVEWLCGAYLDLNGMIQWNTWSDESPLPPDMLVTVRMVDEGEMRVNKSAASISWGRVMAFKVQAPRAKGARLPTGASDRKATPMARGLLDYFPLALAEVARVSKAGNDQHNPGQELHWDRTKSLDHADCIVRHLVDRGTIDEDGMRHSAKVAWRCLALLETELEKEQNNG